MFLSPFVVEKCWPCLNISPPKVWVTEGWDCSSLPCWILQSCPYGPVSEQGFQEKLFLLPENYHTKNRYHTNKGTKSCKWWQATLPSRKTSLVYTTQWRWNHAISSICSQLAVKQKVEAFPAKSYLLHVYCLFFLFKLLRKCLDVTWKKTDI